MSATPFPLDGTTFKGNSADYELSEDGLTFTKNEDSDCSISSLHPVAINQTIEIEYGPALITYGWLLIGVHSSPHAAAVYSPFDADCYGLNVTLPDSNQNNVWKGGIDTNHGYLHVEDGSIIRITLGETQLTISCEQYEWSEEVELPPGRTWHLHFSPHSASFRIGQ